MGEDGLDVHGDAARSSFVLMEGFDAFAMIWFFLIVIPESWKFVMVVTSRSFLATAKGMSNSFFVCYELFIWSDANVVFQLIFIMLLVLK